MKLALENSYNLLSVVDAVSLIARHIVDIEGHPALAEDGTPLPVGQSLLEQQGRPAPDIQLIKEERKWMGLIRAGWTSKKLIARSKAGFALNDPNNALEVFVKPSELAQWLVDIHRTDVVLDGELIEPTPQPQKFKRKALVKEYEPIWPSIRKDLQEGSRNGLMEASSVGSGYYLDQPALHWARGKDKLRGSGRMPTALNDLPSFSYLIKR